MLLAFHLTSAIIGDALAAIVGVLSLIYIWEDHKLSTKQFSENLFKFPSLRKLDKLIIRFLIAAFCLISLGMLSGIFLAQKYWGAHWYTDPRQVWSFVIWGIFASLLVARYISGWRGKKAAWLTLMGVILTMLGLVGFQVSSLSKHETVEYREQ